jgi:hypothetical protein
MDIHKIYARPYTPIPSIFGKIDRAMRINYQGKSSLKLTGKEGIFDTKEYKLVSTPEQISDNLAIQFSGKTDCIIDFADGTAGILDFKTSEVKEAKLELYSPQLYAYREAYPHKPVSKMGLLCQSPSDRAIELNDQDYLPFNKTWVEIPINDEYWNNFKRDLAALLLTPFHEVEGKATCQYCQFQRAINGITTKNNG